MGTGFGTTRHQESGAAPRPRPRPGRMKFDDEDEGCAVVDVASLESEPEGAMRAGRVGGGVVSSIWDNCSKLAPPAPGCYKLLRPCAFNATS